MDTHISVVKYLELVRDWDFSFQFMLLYVSQSLNDFLTSTNTAEVP